MPTPDDVLACARGLVEAPAGCGKTYLLTRAAERHDGRRTLVLTHTRAGVWVIRDRIGTAAAQRPPRIATLDGWMLWLLGRFPGASGFSRHEGHGVWKEARQAAACLVRDEGVRTLLRATYSLLLVDEYQDCNLDQHALVVALAEALPTVVLGDHMQRVFGFGGDTLPAWSDVQAAFPLIGVLAEPWRWRGQEDFGRWILAQRNVLAAGGGVDLRGAPLNVIHVVEPPDEAGRREARRKAVPAPDGVRTLVVTDARDVPGRQDLARTGIRLAVVEPVTLSDLTVHAAAMDGASGEALVERLLGFAQATMTGVAVPRTMERVRALRANTARIPATLEEADLLRLIQEGRPRLHSTLSTMATASGRWAFRPDLLEAMRDAMSLTASRPGSTLRESAVLVRDRRADGERRLPPRAVGSTLLLKGLEAQRTVVMDTEKMTACDLYVALSRASQALVVVSRSPVLVPRRLP